MKDAAQDVAEDVMQDVAGDVLGAAEDGSLKVLIVARVIFQRRNPRPTQACRPPRSPWATHEGQTGEGRGAGRDGGRCGERATGRGAGLGLRGPGGEFPSEVAFPSYNYLACSEWRLRRWERQSSFVKKAAQAENY